MKYFISLLFFLTISLNAQNDELLSQVFSEKENFSITTTLGSAQPTTYSVLNQTDPWKPLRFKISDAPLTDTAIKRMKNNEYHPYNHTYLFKDSSLNATFSAGEKLNLYNSSVQLKPRPLNFQNKNVKFINSMAGTSNGFFFALCDPVFSTDGKYAFVDFTVYEKTKYTKDLKSAYFATVCIMYYKTPAGWERLKVIQYLFL